MPNKYQLVNEMANETLKEITQSGENWTKFLNTASNNYKYSFNEQVLIYAQKPNATACADIETWNNKLKRWVNKGAKGIALISIEDGRSVLRHVFDISDTHSGINRNLKLWEVKSSYENGLIETLENSFGNLEIKSNLAEAIYSSSMNLVEDNYQDYLVDLRDVLENSSLQNLSEDELESLFKGILINSISYMTLNRCGIDPLEHFSYNDFELIKQFDTKSVISRLGAATSDISEQVLREIASSVRNFEKSTNNMNRTFVNNQKTNYYNNENKNNEGRNDYDNNRIQTNGRLSDTTSSFTQNQDNATGEILKNEGEILEGIQKRSIRGIDVRWQDGRTLRRDRGNGTKNAERSNQESSREEQNRREFKGDQPNGMGTRNELNKKSSRGDSNDGVDIQLNLFSDIYIPPIRDLPSQNEQKNIIEAQAEVDNTPAFSFTQDMIDTALKAGTGHQNGKFRVYRLYQETYSSKDRQNFLKKEFNYYGTNGVKGLEGIWVEYSPGKGLKLSKSNSEDNMQVNWATIEKRIGELISLDRYFTSEEKENYQNWLENEYEDEKWMFDSAFKEDKITDKDKLTIENIEKNYKLTNGNYFHFHTSEEGYYYSIYDQYGNEQDGGLLEYSDNKENQTLIDIRKRLAEFTNIKELSNENLKEVSQEFIDELEAKEVFLNEENNTAIIIDKKQSAIQNETQEKINYHIEDNLIGEGTPKEKVARNIDAIKLLKKLEDENRLANKEEQEVLSKYVGWGGLPDVFDQNKSNWSNEYNELKEILTDEEYESARASTLTAFYTPPIVIKSIYKALENMGLEQANILEPSCGIGNFLGMIPEKLENSNLYGIELDSISGRIAKQLYQKADIRVEGYEKADLPDSFFDVAIGNVPFGDFKVNDSRYDKNNFLIHDYFFAKTLDKVRPGGVVAFITSKGTMDKANPEVRKYIAQRADLLGAIRLPDNTFTKNAGTKVTSDIIFLQKRESLTDIIPDWVYLDRDDNNITMNNYFIDNPEMILGNMEMVSTAYGYDSTCKADESTSLEEQLNYAITNIHGELQEYISENEIEQEDSSIPARPNVKNFSYTVVDDKIYFRENSKMYLQDNLPLTNQNRIKGLITLREQVRELIDFQLADRSDEYINIAQMKLNEIYDRFTKEYGLINSRANENAFSNDSSYFLLCSLEKLDGEGKFIGKADIFTKRTIKAKRQVLKVDTPDEALIISIKDKAKVDLNYMQELCGIDMDTMLKSLEGVIFRVPEEGNPNNWVIADEYLSGNVREKLKVAEEFAKEDSSFNINVEKLKEVIPKDLTASEIGVKLGSTWIPPEVIREFIFELLETPRYNRWDIHVKYSNITSEWYIEGKSEDRDNVKAYSTYGTPRISAYKIIEQTLNLKDVKIFDTIIDDEGRKQRVLNKKETAIASSKQDAIKDAFLNWIWEDPDRRNKLVRLYNDKFNSIRPREYDGSHIEFVGMNPEIKLRKHQLNAVAHVLYGKNVLLAHEVGAGKTYEMVAAAMESKRLGLCNKSLFVVPNHIIEQFASEFLDLYPSANILVATKKDFETKNRKKFCSRIATGEFDAIIIGHSQFEKIPMSVERQKTLLQEQINDITNGITEEKNNKGEYYTIKQLEKTKKSLETRLEKLNKQERKDDVVTFEELGIDKLFVDEAHNYKNLFLYTKMRNVGGIAQTEAQKSTDLFMKCRYLDEITNGKGTVFATGTPVSNSMAELYTMQRYLQYDELKKNGLEHFDNWASTFGETVTLTNEFPTSTQPGYNFLAWSTDPNAQETLYYPGGEITGYGNITLYAIWTDKCTIAFNPNGGDSTPASLSFGEGGSIVLPTSAGTYGNNAEAELLGWAYTANNDYVYYKPGDIYNDYAHGTCTLYAVWDLGNVVYIDTNGGSYDKTYEDIVPQMFTFATGLGVNLPDYAGHYSSLELKGWQTKPNNIITENDVMKTNSYFSDTSLNGKKIYATWNILQTGQYVDYTPITGSFTSSSTYNGSSNQNFSTITGLNWRVLGENTEDNKLILISDKIANTKFTLKGINGYNNGVLLLNNACKSMYSNSNLGVTGRSLNIDDIEAHMTYDKTTYSRWGTTPDYGKEHTATDDYYPKIFADEKTGAPNGKYGSKYDLSEQEEYVTGRVRDTSRNMKGKFTYYTFTMSTSTMKNQTYVDLFSSSTQNWIASRCAGYGMMDDDGWYWYIFNVKNGTVAGIELYNSTDEDESWYNDGNASYAIHPVVEIDLTNVHLGESGDGTSSSPYSITAR